MCIRDRAPSHHLLLFLIPSLSLPPHSPLSWGAQLRARGLSPPRTLTLSPVLPSSICVFALEAYVYNWHERNIWKHQKVKQAIPERNTANLVSKFLSASGGRLGPLTAWPHSPWLEAIVVQTVYSEFVAGQMWRIVFRHRLDRLSLLVFNSVSCQS